MHQDNRKIFEGLIESRQVRIQPGELFNNGPGPVPDSFDFGRVEGMMLGLAIGDALGNTSEGMLPSERQAFYGEIRDYLPNRYAGNQVVGLPSDDSQLAFWTLEQMIADGGFIPENVAERFCRERIFGIGNTVRQFISNMKVGKPWFKSGPPSAGNGALMRIAPMLIPHLATGTKNLWIDTALCSMLTHNDAGSISACLAFVYILRQLMLMEKPPEPAWWAETYVRIARDLEGQTCYHPRGGPLHDEFWGPIWKMVKDKATEAYSRSLSVKEACSWWYSGAFLLETVPSVIYILMRHADDFEEPIVRAVNDTKDNDTIAAIVGAAVGALHGKEAIPKRWVQNLPGRTVECDDGKVFELIALARDRFWPARE
jgi:ADP-ribosylglycohydrolase